MRESETDRHCAHKYRTNMLPNGERADPRERARVARSAHGTKQQVSHKLFQIGQEKKQNTKQVVCVWKMDSGVVAKCVFRTQTIRLMLYVHKVYTCKQHHMKHSSYLSLYVWLSWQSSNSQHTLVAERWNADWYIQPHICMHTSARSLQCLIWVAYVCVRKSPWAHRQIQTRVRKIARH